MSRAPTLFLLVGLPATDKTTIARQIESERRAVRFSPDEWMLPLFGASDPDGERDVLQGRFIWTAHRVLLAGADAVSTSGCGPATSGPHSAPSAAEIAGAEPRDPPPPDAD